MTPIATPTYLEAEFLEWLAAHGADVSKLVWPVRDAWGGRTAYTKRAIAPGEPFLRVPEELWMTPSKALASDMGELAALANLGGDALLATFVWWEARKGESSFWAPYLKIATGGATISSWTQVELEELRDPELADRAKRRGQWVADLHARLFNLRVREQYCVPSLAAFTAAWNVVQARAFGRKLRETALVPWADCLNHDDSDATYDTAPDGTFRLYPTTAVSEGVEALNTYGRNAPNAKLLLEYGFALENNRHDKIRIPVALRDDDLLEAKRRILAASHVPHLAYLTVDRDTDLLAAPRNADALALLRVAVADDPTNFDTGAHITADVPALDALVVLLRDLLYALSSPDDDDRDAMARAYAELTSSHRGGGCGGGGGGGGGGGPPLDHHQRVRLANTLFALRYRSTRAGILEANHRRCEDALNAAILLFGYNHHSTSSSNNNNNNDN